MTSNLNDFQKRITTVEFPNNIYIFTAFEFSLVMTKVLVEILNISSAFLDVR